MNNKQLLEHLIEQNDAFGILTPYSSPVNEFPNKIVDDIKRFREEYGNLNLSDTKFYTYSFPNMLIGIAKLNAVRVEWEHAHPSWLTTHEITFSVYPAMSIDNVLNFYFVPTWIEKDSFEEGKPMRGRIVDIVGAVRDRPDPVHPNRPYYFDVKGYIYDLGSSCP